MSAHSAVVNLIEPDQPVQQALRIQLHCCKLKSGNSLLYSYAFITASSCSIAEMASKVFHGRPCVTDSIMEVLDANNLVMCKQ